MINDSKTKYKQIYRNIKKFRARSDSGQAGI